MQVSSAVPHLANRIQLMHNLMDSAGTSCWLQIRAVSLLATMVAPITQYIANNTVIKLFKRQNICSSTNLRIRFDYSSIRNFTV